jgi:hypothetical protein
MADPIPTRVLAGVTVPDTPLITAALAYLRARQNDVLYNHVVRCWLFGFLIAPRIPALADRDLEVHSIAALFHDLGLGGDAAGDVISPDKRFEVDGAEAAREFLKREGKPGEWDKHRLQLVWDAIALHSTFSIAAHKEIEVRSCLAGIFTDLTGPVGDFGGLVTKGEWEEIVTAFPRGEFRKTAQKLLCGVCRVKPETTFDNFLRDYGERFVEGYSAAGKRIIDVLEASPE